MRVKLHASTPWALQGCLMNVTFFAAGITAASGISAELGIPLTHRGLATSVAFITGHAREGGEDELDETVTAAADTHTTLVVYMGLNTLPALLDRLQNAGLPLDTPAAAVERGTTLHQRAVYAPLNQLTQVCFLACFTDLIQQKQRYY